MSGLPQHIRRRRARLILFGLLTLVSLGLAWWLLVLDDDEAIGQLAGVAGLFVALAALAVSLAQLLPPPPAPRDTGELADDLAATVRAQWQEEVRVRQLRDPRVIPLSWAATRRPVAEEPEALAGAQVGGRVLRLSLDGRLDGSFDEAAARLAAGYRQIPSGRLVVLGEPGAGKTVLATMLTLGLLDRRAPQEAVPVLLPVSTWDPVSESLNDWMVRTLATAYYGGQAELPRRLLHDRLLLPVLDGLDEMPESSRRSAVRALNAACGDGRGVVLTCRSAEYQDVIEGGSPVLRRAPVAEVAPVSVADAIGYLDEVSWPQGEDWQPVYEHLRTRPDSPVATALSTPLALSLARTVYLQCERDPAELLGFDSPHAVEDHLVDHVVTAAYAPPTVSAGLGEDDRLEWQGRAAQAEQYLTFLATYLHRHRERDLAWWLMSGRLLSRWAGIVVGIATGLVTTTAVALLLLVADEPESVENSVSVGVPAAVLAMLAWYAVPDRLPGRLSPSVRGSLGRLGRGFRTGVTLTALLALPVLASAVVFTTLAGKWSAATLVDYGSVVVGATGVALAVCLALAVHAWLDAPSDASTGSGPAELLRQDRESSLTGATVAGLVLAVLAGPLLTLSITVGFLALRALTRWSGEPLLTDVIAQAAHDVGFWGEPLRTVGYTALPGAVFGVLVLLTRAWAKFKVLHLALAFRKELPWRLTEFLRDARDRQLLRQSAGSYQFRHVRLQERLASRSLAEDRTPVSRASTARRRRVHAVAVAVVLLAAGLLVREAVPRDTSRLTLLTGEVEELVFSPAKDHTLLTIAPEGTVRRWDTRTGRGLGSSATVGDPSSGHLLPRADGALFFNDRSADPIAAPLLLPWDGGPRRRTSVFGHAETVRGTPIEEARAGVVSAGGRYLLTPEAVVDTRTGSWADRPRSVDRTLGFGLLSSDGRRLVESGSHNGTVTVHDVRSGRDICTAGRADIWAMSGDGSRLATVDGKAVRIRDESCRPTGAPIITGYREIMRLALNADGSQLAVSTDGVTRIWSLSEGSEPAANSHEPHS